MICTAKVIESKIKIRSTLLEHLRFVGIHDAAHANNEGGASQQGHLILAVHASISNCRVLVSAPSWQSKNIKSCGDKQYVALPGTSRLDAHDVGTDDPQ